MIGGNITMELEVMTGNTTNEIGERVPTWGALISILGWLDLAGGDSRRTVFNAKIQDSSHVFVADYNKIVGDSSAEDVRATISGTRYDVTLIDDPMGLHKQLEIFLSLTGGQ